MTYDQARVFLDKVGIGAFTQITYNYHRKKTSDFNELMMSVTDQEMFNLYMTVREYHWNITAAMEKVRDEGPKA